MDTRIEKMDQALQLATTETIRPLVQLFLDKMTAAQWGKLKSGYVDKVTEDMITDMCVDLLNTISRYIYEAFKKNLSEGSDLPLMQSPPKSSSSSSGSDGSRKNIIISENQVHECLGETITFTFAEVMGVHEDIRCKSTKEVTELVVKEVTERVNTELSKSSATSGSSSEGDKLLVSKSSTRRLKVIVRHMVKILKKCAAKMTCTFSSSKDKKGQLSPKMEADETKSTLEKSTEQDKELLETVESGQTPITTVEEDGPEKVSSGESFVVTTTEAVKDILKEQGDNICAFEYDDDFSQEELSLFASSSSQDTDEAASKIVRVIMEELKWETGGTPKKESESEDKSRKTSCWKRVGSKIKAFFVHKFAKESILSFVAKLRRKFDCFSSKKDKPSLKLLIEGVDSLLEDMIPPQEDQEIRKGTDEECLYQRIARGISCTELEMIAKQLSNEVSHYLNLSTGRTLHFLVEIQTQVDKFMKLMWNWLNQQAQQHEKKRDLVSVALRQIEEVVDSVPALTEGPLVLERDTLTPVFEAAPTSITNKPAISDEADEAACEITAHPVHEWDELCCVFLVSGLVNQILKNPSINLSGDNIKTTIQTLKEMLWAETTDSDIAVKPSNHHFKRIVKAVHKDLCKKMDGAGMLQMSLLSQDELIYKYIIKTLKRHLVTPKKRSGVNTIFKFVFKTMAKPFSACFRYGRKE